MVARAQDVLLVVDVQNDFVSGATAVRGAQEIIAPINAMAAVAGSVVVATDWHPSRHVSFASAHRGGRPGDIVDVPYGKQKLYVDHCVQGSWGAELDPRLELAGAALVLRKGYRPDLDSFSAFHWNDGVTRTGLAGYLRERDIRRIYVSGIARLGCVMQSALGAAREGFEVFLVDDASVGDAGRSEKECMAQLRDAGVSLVHSKDVPGSE